MTSQEKRDVMANKNSQGAIDKIFMAMLASKKELGDLILCKFENELQDVRFYFRKEEFSEALVRNEAEKLLYSWMP